MNQERLGDIHTEMLQDMAHAVANKYKNRNTDLDIGLLIINTKAKFKDRIRVFDGGQLVFDATRWVDGDQLVHRITNGAWQKKLAAAA